MDEIIKVHTYEPISYEYTNPSDIRQERWRGYFQVEALHPKHPEEDIDFEVKFGVRYDIMYP